MELFKKLSVLAIQQVAAGGLKTLGIPVAGKGIDALTNFLNQRLFDQSKRLGMALHQANQQAWRALEIALAGEALLNQLDRAEDRAFRQQLRAYVNCLPPELMVVEKAEFRQKCLEELRAARKAGLFAPSKLNFQDFLREAGEFARFTDPLELMEAEWQGVGLIAADLTEAGYRNLGYLLTFRPAKEQSLLIMAMRYFFRRSVQEDDKLFKELAFTSWEQLDQKQEMGFAKLREALQTNHDRLELALGEMRVYVVQTHGAVLDIKEEQNRQGDLNLAIYEAVLSLGQRLDLLQREVRPQDSLSLRSEVERQQARLLLSQFKALPFQQQRQSPALLNGLGKLQLAAGDFGSAQDVFNEVAEHVQDPKAQAEAHYNAYQAALEQGHYEQALPSLQIAASLDPARFMPFPFAKFEPHRILGAGGFGVAFLCTNRNTHSKVVLKTLLIDGLERSLADVIREAQTLESIEHPAIIRLRDCDFADAGKTRPYLVMDYFEGLTLADYVAQNGPIPLQDVLNLAHPVAEGLQAAHARGILHRDVKPANLLIRREGQGGSVRWQVKLIDFGLALRQSTVQSTTKNPEAMNRTKAGSSIAGTLDYAPPEQMGRLPGVHLGPYSDVYGFAKTCCFALFQTPQPTFQHWRQVGEPFADLLGKCLAEQPHERPKDFAAILTQLTRLGQLHGGGSAPGRDSGWINVTNEVLEVMPVAPRSQAKPRSTLPPTWDGGAGQPPPPRTQRRSYRGPAVEEVFEEDRPRRKRRTPWPLVLILGFMFLVFGLVAVGYVMKFLGVITPSTQRNTWAGFPDVPGFSGTGAVPGTPAEPKPIVLTDKELTEAIRNVRAGDHWSCTEAADKLAKALPEPSNRRAEVARALEGRLNDSEFRIVAACAKALGIWGDQQSVNKLLEVLKLEGAWSENKKAGAMEGLSKLKDGRAVEPIANFLGVFVLDRTAVEALKRLGAPPPPEERHFTSPEFRVGQIAALVGTLGTEVPPLVPVIVPEATNLQDAVEQAMWDALKKPGHGIPNQACQVLKEIGTKKSIPYLEEQLKNFFVQGDARQAIEAIEKRE